MILDALESIGVFKLAQELHPRETRGLVSHSVLNLLDSPDYMAYLLIDPSFELGFRYRFFVQRLRLEKLRLILSLRRGKVFACAFLSGVQPIRRRKHGHLQRERVAPDVLFGDHSVKTDLTELSPSIKLIESTSTAGSFSIRNADFFVLLDLGHDRSCREVFVLKRSVLSHINRVGTVGQMAAETLRFDLLILLTRGCVDVFVEVSGSFRKRLPVVAVALKLAAVAAVIYVRSGNIFQQRLLENAPVGET